MVTIKQFSPVQNKAIAQYERIANQFPVGVIFIFNPNTLGGVFYYHGNPTPIKSPQQLKKVWNNLK